ncbi:MAG: glycosyltransferase family 1 protein [Chloroflexota bacterium]|nr:glycosyltransferase family 4 protein [Dehalococcoidia bacterium]MDW8252646.1 glycosyltransferase family 1 protein [Chloroflexota bacterium]
MATSPKAGMLTIGIDNVSPGEATARAAPGGMRLYLQALTREFARLRPTFRFVLFTPEWADDLFDGQLPAGVEVVQLKGVPRRKSLRVLYQQGQLAAAVNRRGVDVFFATATVAPLFLRMPVVVAIQFLQFYETPLIRDPLRTAYLRCLVPLSARRATRLITFSESARQDLRRYVGVSPEKVVVIPHGLSEEVWAAAEGRGPEGEGPRLTGGRPFILYVSATYPYKNHHRLIEAFAQLKRARPTDHVLLLVGSEAGVSFASLRETARKAGVADAVIIAGRVAHAAPLYRQAALAVIPSLAETFGYPLLEAMACGCPVVTSNCSSLAELAGDAAILVDPHDPASIAAGLERGLFDERERARLIARGRERAQPYRWSRSAEATLAVLEAAAMQSAAVAKPREDAV